MSGEPESMARQPAAGDTQQRLIQSLTCQFDSHAVLQLLDQLSEHCSAECPRLQLGDAFAVATRAACCAYPDLFQGVAASMPRFGLAALTTPISWRLLPESFDLQAAARVFAGLHATASPLPEDCEKASTVLVVDAARWGLLSVQLTAPSHVVATFALDAAERENKAGIRCALAPALPIEVGREALLLLMRLLESPHWMVGL